MIEQINHIAQLWWSVTIAMFWQVGVLIILIGCVDLIIRRWAWPQLRYALWLMVLIKLILPPTISLSTSVTSGLQPLAKQIVAQENRPEDLNPATATILAHFENSLAESPVEVVSSREFVTEQQPAVVVTGSEIVTGESLNTAYIKLTWQAYAMAIWLAGMFILGGWLFFKLLHLRKEDHKLATTASLPESFYDTIARCAKSLGLRRVPKVVLTRKVACPAVFGVVRPVLLMPVGYISKMTRKDTEHMLLHELAHIKRGDLWVHGFYMLLQVVYWYNPLLWLVRNQMHHLRELCCDATVARILKERIGEYRQTLIDVARRYLAKPTEPGLGLLGLFEDSNRLLVRLNWLKKETWRYQKMKKLTIITTIVLMLAFVLPMAQAQNKPATESGSAETVKVEEQTSQSENTAEIEQKQKQYQQQLSQNLQELEVRLQQLHIQKQKLEKELQAMAQAKQAELQARQAEVQVRQAEVQAAQAKVKAKQAAIKAKEEKDKAEKAKVSAEAHKAEAEAEHWEQWAKKMETWAEQYIARFNSPEFQKQINNLANNQMVQWVNSDEFKQWQKEMQQWSKEYAEAHEEYAKAHEEAESGDHDHTTTHEPHPMHAVPPMPAMPPMPPMPAMPPIPMNVDVPVLPVVGPPEVAAPAVLPVPRSSGTTDGTTPILPGETASTGRSAQDVEVKKDKDGKYVATRQMQFVSKVKPGSPFVIRNNQGRIVLRPSKDGTCDVKAIIQAKTETEAEARAKVEQVGMTVNSSEERYYLKPITRDGSEWKNIKVDLFITIPPGIEPDLQTNMGSVELYDFEGKVKAVANMGSITAVNTTGDIELLTKMGAIEFIAPKNLSAKFNIQNKMGSIESELPLQVKKLDMFKTNAQGTIGTGQATIKMATDMGSINLKWQASSQVEVKL